MYGVCTLNYPVVTLLTNNHYVSLISQLHCLQGMLCETQPTIWLTGTRVQSKKPVYLHNFLDETVRLMKFCTLT